MAAAIQDWTNRSRWLSDSDKTARKKADGGASANSGGRGGAERDQAPAISEGGLNAGADRDEEPAAVPGDPRP